MVIKVYISQPYYRRQTAELEDIRNRLYAMVGGKNISFGIVSKTRCEVSMMTFDGLINDLSNLGNADFVIFSEQWKTDRRCLVENEIVTRYGIPYCEVKDLEKFFKNYICGSFKFDEPNNR